MTKKRMTPWHVTQDPFLLRRMGKLGEELNECGKAANRIIIQGIDGVDPKTGITNKDELAKEIADVLAQCECSIEALKLDRVFIAQRKQEKIEQMDDWEAVLKEQA